MLLKNIRFILNGKKHTNIADIINIFLQPECYGVCYNRG